MIKLILQIRWRQITEHITRPLITSHGGNYPLLKANQMF